MNLNLSDILKAKGISPSVQRVSILRYMTEHHTHPTVEIIHEALSPSIPTLSKTTIYNTLTLFSQKGLIDSFVTDDNATHYDAVMTHHAHFKCVRCKRIFDLPFPELGEVENSDFEINDIKLFYYGTCRFCKEHLNN